MKKTTIYMLGLLAIAMAIAVSCKKNNDDLNQTSNNVGVEDYGPQSVSAPNEQYIEKQLRWIAKGIPKLAKDNTPFRNEVENRLLNFTDDFFAESHTYFQGWFTTNLSLDYEQEVYDNINHFFSTNDYDRDFFEGFTFDGEDWFVGLYGPEIDVVDKTLQHVVTIQTLDESEDESWGYYIDSVSLDLDSILLDEENFEDYYVWVVFANHPHQQIRNKWSTEICSCPDGKCDLFVCGEHPSNCADCPTPPVGKKTLRIIEYSLHIDNKPYQESWLSNQYEINIAYLIEDKNVPYAVKENTSDRGTTSSDDREKLGLFLEKIPRNDIRRCRVKSGGGTSCKGEPAPRVTSMDRVLTTAHDPTNDRVLIAFYEYDPVNDDSDYDNFSGYSLGGKNLYYASKSGAYNNNAPFIITSSTMGWTTHTHNGITGEKLTLTSSDGELSFILFRSDN